MDEDEMDTDITNLEAHRGTRGGGSSGGNEGDRRMRPPRASTARDPGGLLRRLECFDEVDEMVREGALLRRIVLFIQFERGEVPDLSERALMGALKDYRGAIQSDSAEPGSSPVTDIDEDDPFAELHGMRRMFRYHEERIYMEGATERNLNKLFSTTHKEIDTYGRLGTNIMTLKHKFGLLDTERGSHRQRHGSGLPGRLDVAALSANPESRHRVMGFMEALIRDPELMDTINEERKPPPEKEPPKKKAKKKLKKKPAKKKLVAKKKTSKKKSAKKNPEAKKKPAANKKPSKKTSKKPAKKDIE